MHSKRGRKINQNRPSTHARDTSRAFRARQAAHRQALEQRIVELEAENNRFRQIHGYLPSSRPPLGRGPTGLQSPFLPADPSTRSRNVSVAEPCGRNDSQSMLLSYQSHSPTSRPTLQSPSLPTDPSMCSHDVLVTEPGDWNDFQLMLLNHQSCSSTSGPSLESPSLPTHPKMRSRDVPVTKPSDRNDPQLMLSSHWYPIASDVYLSSPNSTSAQCPDGPIDGLSGGRDFPTDSKIRDPDEIYTHCYHQHNADMSSQNRSTPPQFVDLWYDF